MKAVAYHYIDGRHRGYAGVPAERFAQHIGLLKEHGLRPTFDDGLVNQLEAGRMLARAGVFATFFIPGRPVSTGRWCTQHLLHVTADEIGWEATALRLGAKGCPEADRLYHYEADRHARAAKYAVAFLMRDADAYEQLWHKGCTPKGFAWSALKWYMSADDVRELARLGHRIGCHGYSHVPYTRMGDAEARNDMECAALAVEEITGERPDAFSWPFGRFEPRHEEMARQLFFSDTYGAGDRIDAAGLEAWISDRSPTTVS